MAVIVITNDPHGLLETIKQEIAQEKINTWAFSDSTGFTYCSPRWINKAYLVPSITTDTLELRLTPPPTLTLTPPSGETVYEERVIGVYHGRFVEMLMNHFPDEFETAIARPHYNYNTRK